jgi:tRNA(Arg) A34 adenosine deaminase TadA
MLYTSKKYIIDQLIYEALIKSPIKNNNLSEFKNISPKDKSSSQFQLAACLINSNKMVTRPCRNISKDTSHGYKNFTLHAEANAIKTYYGESFYYNSVKKIAYIPNEKKNKKLDLLVIRINKVGDLCTSRPCYNCLDMMQIVGIRKVYYIVNDTIVCENVKDMISIQSSSTIKHTDRLLNINNFNSINDYYITLLKKKIPNTIKYNNLKKFINYNLNILENFTLDIVTSNNNNILIIKLNDIIILESNIII